MGYKYGVWYVYPKDCFPTKHIGHFTVTCFMEKNDAFKLYDDLVEKVGKTNVVQVECNNSVIFEKNMYDDDENNTCSWGFKGKILNWNNIKKITENYKCNFSHVPHSSIEYSKYEKKLTPFTYDNMKLVDVKLHVVDITDDNPIKWNILNI